jgi:hypothetical protein
MCADANCERTETKIRRQTDTADESELQNTGRESTMNPENRQPEPEKQQNQKLLRLMTGYNQHANPFQLYATTQRKE